MPESYDRIIVHDTFSTKYRTPIIDEVIEPELYGIIHSELVRQGCKVIAIGGTDDHVHLVHSLPRTKTIADIMNAVKSVSSKWIKTKGPQYREFAWQDGYGTFSVDYRKLDGLIHYVRNQRNHHGKQNTKMTFKQEYTRVLRAYGYSNFTREYVFPEPPTHRVEEPMPVYHARRAASRSAGACPRVFVAHGACPRVFVTSGACPRVFVAPGGLSPRFRCAGGPVPAFSLRGDHSTN